MGNRWVNRTKASLKRGRKTIADFWALVDKRGDDECWPWEGARATRKCGYVNGKITIDGTEHQAHRLAYQLCVGEIPEGRIIRHTCDFALCCNPAHLRVGTPQDNVRDRVRRGRSWHKLTDDQVREIRASDTRLVSLANKYGVSITAVSLIRNRKRRQSVPDHPTPTPTNSEMTREDD